MTEDHRQQPRQDRRLGEEWADWDGHLRPAHLQVSARLYAGLNILLTLMLAAAGVLVIWLIGPRLEQLLNRQVILVLTYGWLGLIMGWLFLLLLALSKVSWALRLLQRLGGIRWSLNMGLSLGRKLGFSKDEIGHAYVQLHNRLEVLPSLIKDPVKLLVLAPRCLQKESQMGLKALKDKYGFSQVIVVGGTEARRAIKTVRPRGIIAIACERDLLSGIKDLRGKIPVIAFPNQMPEGPCKNTVIPLDSIEKTVTILLGKPWPHLLTDEVS